MNSTGQDTRVRLWVIGLLCLLIQGSWGASPPAVYCFSIGVSDNPDGPLKNAPSAATHFAQSIEKMFSTNAKISLLISPSDPATPQRVERLLRSEIPQIPRYSTVLFYFAGHGLCNANGVYDEDLHLLLSGANADGYRTNALRFADLLDVLERTKMVTGIVILDSCYSGSIANADTRSGRLLTVSGTSIDPRFVFFTATSQDQKTFLGDFTTNLLSHWISFSSRKCVLPDELFKAIETDFQSSKRNFGYRNPSMLPNIRFSWCMSNFGKPSSIILILGTEALKDSMGVEFSDNFRTTVNFASTQRYFLRFVPKQQSIIVKLKNRSQELAVELKPKDFESDVVVLRTDGTSLAHIAATNGAEFTSVLPSDLLNAAAIVTANAGNSQTTSQFYEVMGRSLVSGGLLEEGKKYYAYSAAFPSDERRRPRLVAMTKPFIDDNFLKWSDSQEQLQYLADLQALQPAAANTGWERLYRLHSDNPFGTLVLGRMPSSVRDNILRPRSDYVKVGVLHSLSGTLALNETSLKDVLLFTFDEINRAGGIKTGGKNYLIEPVVVDPASNWPLFAEKAKQLLEVDKVAAVFGGWTSASRKSMLPILEKDNGLLFYPGQYEGEEFSRNVFYTAEAPNQQAIPAVDYMLAEGKRKFYLLGSDYVYPRTVNKILKLYLRSKNIPDSDVVELYTPFGHAEYQTVVSGIKRFAAGGKATVVSTLIGDTIIPFFKEFTSAGLTPENCPVVLLSVTEEELRNLPAAELAGHLGCWSYFMSVKSPENTKFTKDFQAWLKAPTVTGVDFKVTGVDPDGRVTSSPMNLSRVGVHLWKQAVEKAGTFEVNKVREALVGQRFKGPAGEITMQENHHLMNNVYMGETLPSGQFKILMSFTGVAGEPFAEKFLPKKQY